MSADTATAALEPAAPVERQRWKRLRPKPLLTVACALAATAPVLTSLARALGAHWQPAGDQGVIATRAFDVFSSHTPLVGQYSQASTVAGHPIYSPGPLLYWLLAVPARIGGPGWLAVAMAVVNAACIAGIVVLARRRGGVALMIAAAVGLILMSRSLAPENLHGVFNPAAGVFPITLLAFLSWSIACGDRRLLPVAVVVASFAAQCHLAYVPPAVGLIAVAIAGAIVRHRTAPAGRLWPWLAGAAAALLICWSAPLVDEVGQTPGNLSVIADAATTSRSTVGAQAGWRVVVRAVGVTPRFLRLPVSAAGALGGVSGGDYGDTRLGDVWTKPSVLATVSAIAILAALVAAAGAGVWRRRLDVTAGAVVALVMCAALYGVVADTPSNAINTLGYTTWWASGVGLAAWLIGGWSVVALVRGGADWRLPLRAPAYAAGLAVTVAAATAVSAAQGRDAHTRDYGPIRTFTAALDHALPPRGTIWLIQRGFLVVPIEPALRYALSARGTRALGNLATLRDGSWYELDHRRYDAVVSIWSNGNTPPVPPERIVARAGISDSRGRHVLTAAVSRPVVSPARRPSTRGGR